jgi:cupin 2 domain-containing protein
MQNIFKTQSTPQDSELFDILHQNKQVRIERILSKGHITESGKWYNQDTDEWVILLQGEAEIEYENNDKIRLFAGDYVFIPANKKHRVIYTSSEPMCIWIAVHWGLKD